MQDLVDKLQQKVSKVSPHYVYSQNMWTNWSESSVEQKMPKLCTYFHEKMTKRSFENSSLVSLPRYLIFFVETGWLKNYEFTPTKYFKSM